MLYFVSDHREVKSYYHLTQRHTKLSRGRQGLASDALLSRLIRLTVETGSLTASLATLDLILFVTFKDNFLHFIPWVILPLPTDPR